MSKQPTIKFEKFHSTQKDIFSNLGPRAIIRAGRRFGKTVGLETVASKWSAFDGQKVGWFSPTYKLLTPSYKRILKTIRPVVTASSRTDGIIETIGGGLVEFWTLNDDDAGRSRSYDRVIIDEASLVKTGLRDIWDQAIAPTLLDRRGTAIMAGTPKGVDEENFFYLACTDKSLGWREFHAPTSANPLLDPDGVANLVNDYAPLVYQQEFLAEFVDWSGSAFFAMDKLLVNGLAVEYPSVCDGVFAVLDTAVKGGKEHDGTAVIYCAMSRRYGTPLIILDYDVVQIDGAMLESWLPSVFENLERLARETRARNGSLGAWIEDVNSGAILVQQAHRRGQPAHGIDSKLTACGKDERAISVSGYVHRGMVKFSKYAYDKITNFKNVSKNHLLAQILNFRIGDKDAAKRSDDLLDTFTYAISIALGNSEGY